MKSGTFTYLATLSVATLSMAALLLCACSSTPEPKKVVAPPEPVTGLHALYQMYGASRTWAQDAQVLSLTSIHVADVKSQPGKAGAWQVVFVSPSLRQALTITYSAIEASTSLHEGVNLDKPVSWNGPRAGSRPFILAAAKKDSDEAYTIALTKAAAYSAKNPGMTITYMLEEPPTYANAAWRVIWGESVGTSAFSVLIDATLGTVLETMH